MTFALEQWFSSCGPHTSSFSITSNTWQVQVFGRHRRPALCIKHWVWSPTVRFNKLSRGLWCIWEPVFSRTWHSLWTSLPHHSFVLRRFPLPRKGCTSSSWKPVHFQEPARPSLPAVWRTPPASFPCSVPSKPLRCDWESVVRNCPHLFSVPRLLSAAPRGSSTSFFHNGKMSIWTNLKTPNIHVISRSKK